MFSVLKARLSQGYRTGKFPDAAPNLPDRFAGVPELCGNKCAENCNVCSEICPADAIIRRGSSPEIDLGKCIFCKKCENACPQNAVKFTNEYRMGVFSREKLIRKADEKYEVDHNVAPQIPELCGKSLKIRQISAGGCAACELDFNVLNTLAWDMGRFGIQVVASPRHADCLLVTGPVTENMLLALKKSYDATPKPSFVIACGSCAISGGIYASSPQTHGGLENILKPDMYVPGCPPHPAVLLDALVKMMKKHKI